MSLLDLSAGKNALVVILYLHVDLNPIVLFFIKPEHDLLQFWGPRIARQGDGFLLASPVAVLGDVYPVCFARSEESPVFTHLRGCDRFSNTIHMYLKGRSGKMKDFLF